MRAVSAICLLVTSAALAACGTVWTVGFMGATLAVQIPQRPTTALSATVTTQPGTSAGCPCLEATR